MAGRITKPTTKIASLRLAAGLTQPEAAAAIGLSKNMLAELEKGRRRIEALALGKAIRMAVVYHCTAEDLIE